MNQKTFFLFGAIFLLFISLHLFGVHMPLHQDEYKWVIYSHPELTPPGTVPHPPLTEFIYTRIGPIVGDNNFRVIPFSFGIINLFLLFYLVKFLYNKKTAFIAVSIFTLSFYSLLATLMVDVDGAIMPFFFLLSVIGYYKWKDLAYKFNSISYFWLVILVIGLIGGFLIKVSFILPIIAIFIDFLIEKKVFSDWKKILKYSGVALLGLAGLVVILWLSKYVFPFFNLSYALGYWEHFIALNRGWFQTAIQCIKAILYTSPFLIIVPFFASKNIISRARVFLIFLALAFVFYILLFDFSIGALDRYLQLLVIPLTIFSSAVLGSINYKERRVREFLLLGVLLSIVIFVVQSVPQYVPPLHPKSEWINRVLSFKWNFLYPFSGGSGPLGFYVSFLVIGVTWIVSVLAFVYAKIKPNYKTLIIVFLIPIGLVYNGIFIEEYLFGVFNGSAPKVLSQVVEYIKNNDDVKMVTVYNDNGGNDIQQLGKYRKRLYIDPKFDINEKITTLNKYKEHYFVLNIPRIDPNTAYQKYFNSCEIVFEVVDKSISGTVYDCRRAPDYKL